MVNMHSPLPHDLFFYISAPYPCSYLDDKEATTLLVDPQYTLTPELYTTLSASGFRRSGDMVYTPRCAHCQSCQPIRIGTSSFKTNRSQRRNLKQNADVQTHYVEPRVHQKHYELFQRYIDVRHDDGSMQVEHVERYGEFFFSQRVETELVEYRIDDHLVGVSVMDKLLDGLSAVYTFFEPNLHHRGLGIYAILWQLAECKRRQLSYLYLGYQIDECQKMAYKTDFKPYQLFINSRWQRVD